MDNGRVSSEPILTKKVTDPDRPLTKREKRELAKEEKREERLRNEKTKKLKNWVIGLLVVIGIFFIGYKGWKWIKTPAGNISTSPDILTVKDSDQARGNPNAKVTLVEYGDFECPACAIYSSDVKRIYDANSNNIRTVYRHFPLPLHTNAVPAAKAAEAAGRQGKFWEMHDILYEKQSDWVSEKNPSDKFKEYAKSLGLDEGEFLSDYKSKEIENKINSDQADGYKLKITSTPTFYLNGKPIDLTSGNVDLTSVINSALAN